MQTARGPEYGFVAGGNREVKRTDVTAPLKEVVRIATEQDTKRYEENQKKRAEAFKIGEEKIAEHGLEMKLVDVEYSFDNAKLLFYLRRTGASTSASLSRIWLLFFAPESSCGRSAFATRQS